MASPNSRDRRAIGMLGANLRDWRVLSGVTAELMAERVGISRTTLHAIESGSTTVKLENVIAVMRVLGLIGQVVDATDPMKSDIGRARAAMLIPKAVRQRKVSS